MDFPVRLARKRWDRALIADRLAGRAAGSPSRSSAFTMTPLSPSRAAFVLVPLLLMPGALAVRAQGARPDPGAFKTQVQPLLAAHCGGCHSAQRQVGGVDLTFADAATAVRKRSLWRRVAEQVEAGTMPPPGSKAMTPAGKAQLAQWSRAAAEYLDPQDPANRDPGPSALRRLTVAEYNATVRELFGIPFDGEREAGLSDPENTTGFDNLAAALTLSPALLEKYLVAAERITDRVFRDPRAKARLLEPKAAGADREAARTVVIRLLRRAYRRPALPVEVERVLKVYDGAVARGDSHEAGIRAVLKPVLASPNFLFRVEQSAAGSAPARVNAHEQAVRLAYFLWGAPPDEALSALADSGKLSDPAVLEGEARRMLADPRARWLTDSFARQWLQLDGFEKARPSTEFFPAFNQRLRKAMREEAELFFDGLRREDRNVLELLDADYTYANAELAAHYGIPGVENKEMQRVALRPEYHRGGLLGMGAVLATTSHTFRTSPTLRGKYILEVLLGTPPPPPPPNAANQLKEGKGKEATSFREQLAQHAADPSCAGCHRKLDPLGFALDNYDAVGAWRTGSKERPLDTSGVLPTGEKLNGVEELKRVLLARKGQFIRNLSSQLLSYALGRELQESDEWTVRQVAAACEKDGYRMSSLVLGVTRSVPFQYRRGAQQ